MAINMTTLFTRLGKGIKIIKDINTSRGTTIPAIALAYKNLFDSASLLLSAAAIPYVGDAEQLYKSGADAAVDLVKTSLQQVLIETVDADTSLPTKDLTNAIAELIKQMNTAVDSVDASTVSTTASAITGNGNGVLVASAKRPDGKFNENMYAETIKLICTDDTSPSTATFTAYGEQSLSDKLSQDYPTGSGITKTLTAVDANSSLLGNGDFDDYDDQADYPDEWAVSVGTIGTTVKATNNESQTVQITGTPTAGTYSLILTNPAGKVQYTDKLAFNAAATVVQAKINALKGFEQVTVAITAGSLPDVTHTVTFKGVAGNVGTMSYQSSSDFLGSISIASPIAGSANSYIDRAVELDSDGAELTTLNRSVNLSALSQYAFNCFMKADVVPAAGVITIDLVDGIGGSVIADQAGTNNTFTITCSALTTGYVAKNGVFRTPKVLPPVVYLRIRISTAISTGTSVFVDQAALAEMDSLYDGGPEVKIFSGSERFTKAEPGTLADYFTLAVANDRAGEFQEYFERVFDMAAKGQLLPSNAAGAETLADSLIA